MRWRRPCSARRDRPCPHADARTLLGAYRTRRSCRPCHPAHSAARAGAAARAQTTNGNGKPFAYGELRARIHALLRRSSHRRRTGRLRVGPLEVDPTSRDVRVGGKPVALTQTEFALLRVLAGAPTTVHTKHDLLKTIWGYHSRSTTRTLDSHACRLRHKLGVDGDRFVINIWGVGYRLIDDPGVGLAGRAA